MPSYEEIVQQSQENVKSLSEKLKELDKLYQDIKELKKVPEIFDNMYQQIVKLSEGYLNTLGTSTKIYLDGSNTLFTTNLKELSSQIAGFEKEILRLVKQIERIENIDLDKEFGKLQKTISEIFGAINSINLTLTTITQTLTGINQSLGTFQTTIDANQKETKQIINNFSESTVKHLNDQDLYAKANTQLLENKIKSISEQNDLIKKELKTSRLIQIIGIILILVLLIFLAIKI